MSDETPPYGSFTGETPPWFDGDIGPLWTKPRGRLYRAMSWLFRRSAK
jgi:hypothetical protein